MAKLIVGMTGDAYRASWQGRLIAATRYRPLGAVVMSVVAHSDDEAMEELLHSLWPDFVGLKPPGLCSAGKIAQTGAIVADIIRADGLRLLNAVIFKDEEQMQGALRRLADDTKLNDDDRIEFFRYAQKWIVADRRLDPTFNPHDPDAKRYAIN
jgi:hypothetical protein